MVFYRKYRPQKIDELDSEAVRESIFSAFSGKSSPHAFLFTGPKGLGKTSAARIVAKVINCESRRTKSKKQRENIEPCNKCEQCISITNGNNMDVLEIDGASNRGIDEIRDLRDKVKLAPFKASMKVYIIDEVHMLTTEAFNALLKTLEEPPAHVVFVLCTTEPHKVPATILSRCFSIQFKTATQDELVRSFQRIVKGEKIKADKEALKAIASLSDGSFRDGAKILEELVLLANGREISKEFVEKKYNVTSIDKQTSDLLLYLKEKNSEKAFKLIAGAVENGTDLKYFVEQVINKLHSLLLEKAGVTEKNSEGPDFELREIKELVNLFSKAYADIKFAVLPQLPLELVIVEWVSEKSLKPASDLDESSNVSAPAEPGARSPSATLATTPPRDLNEGVTTFNSSSNGKTTDVLQKLFEDLIEKVKPYNHSVAGVLRGCIIKSYDGKELMIEANYKFHKEKLEENKTMKILEEAMAEITGDKVNIFVSLRR